MITVIYGNIFDSDANFIVNASEDSFPHVSKEYRKYINHCEKNHINILGSCQYVPIDVWALPMIDTMKNNNVTAYDLDYKYIVNVFCQNENEGNLKTDMKAVKKAMADIRYKAQSIGATIAIPYNIFGKSTWNDVYTIIEKTFGNSDVDVQIWRYE